MPDLRELPDRKGRIRVPISSDKLVGQNVDWFGKAFTITDKGKSNWTTNPATITVKDWVEMQMPTMGKPGHKDDEKGQACVLRCHGVGLGLGRQSCNERRGKQRRTIPKTSPPILASGIRSCLNR